MRHHSKIEILQAHNPLAAQLKVRNQQRHNVPRDPRVENY